MFKVLAMAAAVGFCFLPVGASAAPAAPMSLPVSMAADGASELTPVHYQHRHYRRHHHYYHYGYVPHYRWGGHRRHRWHHHHHHHRSHGHHHHHRY